MALPPHTVAPDRESDEQQPAWRRQFPIDTDKEGSVNRRQLLIGLAATGAAIGCSQFALLAQQAKQSHQHAEHAEELTIARASSLKVGDAVMFHYPDPHHPCLLIRLSEGDEGLVAYSQACTHLACPVVPEPDAGRLFCPCHNGAFDIKTGEPTMGPPRKPLPRVRLRVEGGDVIATAMIHA